MASPSTTPPLPSSEVCGFFPERQGGVGRRKGREDKDPGVSGPGGKARPPVPLQVDTLAGGRHGAWEPRQGLWQPPQAQAGQQGKAAASLGAHPVPCSALPQLLLKAAGPRRGPGL